MAKVAEVKRKDVVITLSDGKERKLKFTLNSFAELEDLYGSVDEAFDKLEKENSMKALRAILWAGILHEEPDITEKQVGALIDIDMMQDLIETLGETLDQDMPQPEPLKVVENTPNV